jgi:hypothetical protein
MIFTELFLASLALAPALALPAAAPTEVDSEVFSFGKWIDGIIDNPDGNHLTPEEAVSAWSASSIGTTRAVGALDKRAPLICPRYSFCKVRITITTSSLYLLTIMSTTLGG